MGTDIKHYYCSPIHVHSYYFSIHVDKNKAFAFSAMTAKLSMKHAVSFTLIIP